MLTTLRADVFRYSAYPPSVSMPGNASCLAVHVVAGAAGPAQPAGDQRVHDHLVAHRTLVTADADRMTQPAFSCPIV